jgi:hypothetical protein
VLADITVLQDKSRLNVIMKDGAVVDTKTPLPEPKTPPPPPEEEKKKKKDEPPPPPPGD